MKFYKIVLTISNWIMRLFYIQLLWILSTLLGFILLGIFPATVAMFSVVRDGIIHGVERPVWKKFIKVYKEEFVKANLLGYVYTLIGIISFLDYFFFSTFSHAIYQIISYVFIIIFVYYIIIGFYIMPLFAHYDMKWYQYIKQAFIFVTRQPIKAVLGLVIIIPVVLLYLFLPAIIIFFGISILSFIMMFYTYQILNVEDMDS